MFISSVSSWCTHNALLIPILKYAGMHILLQDTHFRWWICRCPPSYSHTPICQCIRHKSIYIHGLCFYKCAIFSLNFFFFDDYNFYWTFCILNLLSHLIQPIQYNAQFHVALCHTVQGFRCFMFIDCYLNFIPTTTILKSCPQLNVI